MQQKAEIIESSKKPNFSRKVIKAEYGISEGGISIILKNQKTILTELNSGMINTNAKCLKKSAVARIERKLYDWLCEKQKHGIQISGPMIRKVGKSQK